MPQVRGLAALLWLTISLGPALDAHRSGNAAGASAPRASKPAPRAALPAPGMTNQNVVSLVKAGFSDGLVIGRISAAPAAVVRFVVARSPGAESGGRE